MLTFGLKPSRKNFSSKGSILFLKLSELDEPIAWNFVAYKATFCAHTCSSIDFLFSQH